METFLLFKTSMYESEGGLNDLVGAYTSEEDAREAAAKIKEHGKDFQCASVKDGKLTKVAEGYYSATNGFFWYHKGDADVINM